MGWLSLTVSEGYPLYALDYGGLKKDQFAKVLKSQAQWYSMHMFKPDALIGHGGLSSIGGTLRPRSILSFLRLPKLLLIPPSGPASRPISQESLRPWERDAFEGSYIVNHATILNRY